MYENTFSKILYKKFTRESIEEPTEWKEITKYYLIFGDIRTNTLKKMYILARGGFALGFWYATCETYIYPHPKNPAAGTARFLAQCLVKRIPVGMFAGLSFGAYWYAWNTYFNKDNAFGVIFAANAAWATAAGPVLNKWNRVYAFMPHALFLGFLHICPPRVDTARRRLTQIKLSNPHHYEFDIFGNQMQPLTGINYDFDDQL